MEMNLDYFFYEHPYTKASIAGSSPSGARLLGLDVAHCLGKYIVIHWRPITLFVATINIVFTRNFQYKILEDLIFKSR